jgi:hypothetical protein
MAFLFDTRRVVPSGLACEIVVPEEQLDRIEPGALTRPVRPHPVRRELPLRDEDVHPGNSARALRGRAGRSAVPELKAIAEWLAGWARDING